jgi:aldose sugar dehydrogenase
MPASMKKASLTAALLSPLLLAASCGGTSGGDSPPVSTPAPTPPPPGTAVAFATEELARFDEPWAAAVVPGTSVVIVTQKGGALRSFDLANRRAGTVSGAPSVDYGGQGGLGDVAFLPSESASTVGTRTIYLSWAEAGTNDTRGAAVGRGRLVCDTALACRVEGLTVIWRQSPKVTGRGHYSHRLAFSPDGRYLFVASGDRQKMDPAQDLANNIGKIVRLNLDGTPAAGNPFSGQAGRAQDIWSWGHRNTLGMKFDGAGNLWNLEHGPAGGDELNLVRRGANYGWPLVSEGDHYDGRDIPPHSTRPEFAAPALSWTPVIAPGDFIIHSGRLFPALAGEVLIAGLQSQGLVRVRINGTSASEVARYPMGFRVREVVEAPDGAVLVFEDGGSGRMLRLTPR